MLQRDDIALLHAVSVEKNLLQHVKSHFLDLFDWHTAILVVHRFKLLFLRCDSGAQELQLRLDILLLSKLIPVQVESLCQHAQETSHQVVAPVDCQLGNNLLLRRFETFRLLDEPANRYQFSRGVIEHLPEALGLAEDGLYLLLIAEDCDCRRLRGFQLFTERLLAAG